jgi:hypothetical protein
VIIHVEPAAMCYCKKQRGRSQKSLLITTSPILDKMTVCDRFCSLLDRFEISQEIKSGISSLISSPSFVFFSPDIYPSTDSMLHTGKLKVMAQVQIKRYVRKCNDHHINYFCKQLFIDAVKRSG